MVRLNLGADNTKSQRVVVYAIVADVQQYIDLLVMHVVLWMDNETPHHLDLFGVDQGQMILTANRFTKVLVH